jgi:tetratricopeptide (TPR) repeat protein
VTHWDFFVSYTQADRAWAEWVAWVLEEDGYRVLVQAWDFVPGSNWVQRMQEGSSQAERTIAVLSAAYLSSVYGGAEWQAAWANDADGPRRKLIPVRVEDCDRPGLLGGVTGLDLFDIQEATAKARLRDSISGAIRGRAKPDSPPSFPGRRAIPRGARFPGALPTVWNVPARNPNFVGRERALEDLDHDLRGASTITVHSLHGMGGVGKTRLAVEYAHAHAYRYDLVWWFAAEESRVLPDQFAALAARMGLEPHSDPRALQVGVHDALRGVPGWLLIFDNADNVDDIRDWLPSAPIPPGTPGHVLVTTRRSGFAPLGPVHDVDVVEPAEGIRLLRARATALDEDIAAQLTEELGRLPLALEHAAAFLDRTAMDGRSYLALVRTRADLLFSRGSTDRGQHALAGLWDISIERINAENPASSQLLDICAHLAPEPIPLNLFSTHPDQLPDPLASVVADPLSYTEAVAVLVDYSLARRTPTGLQVHRLLQAAIREQHRRLRCEASGAQLSESATAVTGPQLRALRVLAADAPEEFIDEPQLWPRWAVLLPHVLIATSRVEDVASDPSNNLELVARLLERAGTYLTMHARNSEAGLLFERVLRFDEARYGSHDPLVASDLSNVAWVLKEQGDLAAARPLAERALHIDEISFGSDHPKVATDLNNLATVLRDMGKPAEARPLLERALRMGETDLGLDHPLVATRLHNLATVSRDLGEPTAARPLAERALHITENRYGAGHPNVAHCLGSLVTIFRALGNPAEAQPLAERALRITETSYGPNHPEVASNLGNLALTLVDLGEPATARPLAERALQIAETSFGRDRPGVRTALSNLAAVLHAKVIRMPRKCWRSVPKS